MTTFSEVQVSLADKTIKTLRTADIVFRANEVKVLYMPPLTKAELAQLQAEPKLNVTLKQPPQQQDAQASTLKKST